MDDESPYEQGDELSEFEQYGTTPPRTRRRIRERKQRDRDSAGSILQPKTAKSRKPINRRNTCNSMFDELISKADDTKSDQVKRTDKRSMQLQRGSERDLKLDITSAQTMVTIRNTPKQTSASQPCIQIESCKQFKSLFSKPIVCSKKQTPRQTQSVEGAEELDECTQSRAEFHKMLSLLVRMGCGSKTQERSSTRRLLSKEEYLWQNELKDIIWLELQAYHADRTPTEQDNFLCSAREVVPQLLNEIMSFKFHKHKRNPTSSYNSDSGVEDECSGCLSMYCQSCSESRSDARKDVENLLKRLEHAEALFPSSKAFGELHPLYKSDEFVGRVKSMCLWYNMTGHHQLAILIVGKLLSLREHGRFNWPLPVWEIDSCSPTDSNSSASSAGEYLGDKMMYGDKAVEYNSACVLYPFDGATKGKDSPCRKYIEYMLKTRGLTKGLNFLNKLHDKILGRAQLTLEKPVDAEIFKKSVFEDPEHELQRYGAWSPEAKAITLPSYKPCFLFLSALPLEFTHEFLLMRLEQKPTNPSPLSVRQLLRELKEGLKIAMLQRERFVCYVESVFLELKHAPEVYSKRLEEFDESVRMVFGDYLEYLEMWALLQHDSFQKSLLEEEYKFCVEIVEKIPKGREMISRKFCSILACILYSVGNRLLERLEELSKDCHKDDDLSIKQNLLLVCRELQSLLNEEREMGVKTISFCKMIIKDKMIKDYICIAKAIVHLKVTIVDAISRIQTLCDYSNCKELDDNEKASLMLRTREVLLQGYRFGFEFHKEMSELVPDDKREQLARSMVHFAHLWMQFVRERCDRGRGMRPRWAYQGLDFLLTVCEPCNTKYLTDEEFENLKREMDGCISHVIGTSAPSTPDSGFFSASPRPTIDHMRSISSKSRGNSPSPRPNYRSQRSNASSRKTSMEQSPIADGVDSPGLNSKGVLNDSLVKIKLQPISRAERVKEAIENLESEKEDFYKSQRLIGRVIDSMDNKIGKGHIRRRHVTFTWQRGIKIGQGRFGKVYTAVNNNTGEMMAVKEIALQHNDSRTICRIAEELKILEGITHRNLVRYYGIEVHKEEMLIFMEFCAEGTLESLVQGTESGLPELIVRKYTFQLLSGVAVLHEHGIVHRDIKTANIFLTDEGNCLKIGDFGCAAKIKSHTTMPGELKGFVGTQAYMAPEVFTKTMTDGHGRAADIWSVGCVVVEMASGKRPWYEYDSNYQIMFKVGMGESPEPPIDMIDEGLDFLDRCFQHDPSKRATATELLDHNFVKVGDELV